MVLYCCGAYAPFVAAELEVPHEASSNQILEGLSLRGCLILQLPAPDREREREREGGGGGEKGAHSFLIG